MSNNNQKDASTFTLQLNSAIAKHVTTFSDDDFINARRGFVAPLPQGELFKKTSRFYSILETTLFYKKRMAAPLTLVYSGKANLWR